MIRKTKLFYIVLPFIVLFFMSSTIFAENNIYGLGYTKVKNARYLDNKIFFFELKKLQKNNSHPREKLFRGSETVSFTFNPDELDGIIVVSNKEFREDIKITGKNFVNLLLKKEKNNEYLNLTCGIKSQTTSEASDIKSFKLTYFQINENE